MLMGILRRSLQDVVVPELKQIRAESAEIRTTLQMTNKRLDDMNVHLVEQSRRIDDTNKRIDAVHVDVIARIDATNRRLDETNDRLNRLYEVVVRREEHEGLSQRVARLEQQIAGLLERVAA